MIMSGEFRKCSICDAPATCENPSLLSKNGSCKPFCERCSKFDTIQRAEFRIAKHLRKSLHLDCEEK